MQGARQAHGHWAPLCVRPAPLGRAVTQPHAVSAPSLAEPALRGADGVCRQARGLQPRRLPPAGPRRPGQGL